MKEKSAYIIHIKKPDGTKVVLGNNDRFDFVPFSEFIFEDMDEVLGVCFYIQNALAAAGSDAKAVAERLEDAKPSKAEKE